MMWYASKQKEHKILSSDLGSILAFAMYYCKVEIGIGIGIDIKSIGNKYR